MAVPRRQQSSLHNAEAVVPLPGDRTEALQDVLEHLNIRRAMYADLVRCAVVQDKFDAGEPAFERSLLQLAHVGVFEDDLLARRPSQAYAALVGLDGLAALA